MDLTRHANITNNQFLFKRCMSLSEKDIMRRRSSRYTEANLRLIFRCPLEFYKHRQTSC